MVQRASIASSDAGFATVAVIGVCAALAAVMVGILQLAQSQHDRVNEAMEREQQEQAVRSAIALEVAELVAKPRPIPATVRKEIDRWTIEIEISNEQSKLNVLTADADTIRRALADLEFADRSALADEIVRIRDSRPDTRQFALERLLEEVGLSGNEIACAQEALTVYGSSLDPLATGRPESSDGGVFNLQARIVLPQPSDLRRERVFVVTGDGTSPVIELLDRQFRASSRKGCRDDEV
jgi:hypothetical protein